MFTGSPVEPRALVDAGEARTLGVMSKERSGAFPDVPTLREQGIDFALSNGFSLRAPKGLLEDVKAAVVTAAEEAHQAVRDAPAQRGITPLFDGPDAFTSLAADFSDRARGLLTDLGLAR